MAEILEQREHWKSKIGFILAATGSAVGLGNIWKFPYITYANKGGAFVLTYLLAVAAVGVPIMIAEILLGRSTAKNPVGAFKKLAGKYWQLIGWLGVTTGFVILSYYSVVAGWTLEYFIKSITNAFSGLSGDEVDAIFVSFVSNPARQIFWHGIFMLLTTTVVMGGVAEGIERATKVLMPVFFILLLVLLGTSLQTPGALMGIKFLFRPSFSELTLDSALEAFGHSFFTLSLGMGAMITYGSYMKKKDSIPKAAITVSIFDTMIALIA
ncbi:MAG: sodium-dependent transporter, partial [Fidelibacterota bacterium]